MKRKPVRFHRFNGTRYIVDHVEGLYGVCDTPEIPKIPVMMVLDKDDTRTLHSQLHEALEASGFCDKCMHDENGEPRTWDAAKYLWREGWRRIK
jgi:hypothetical protein